MKKFLSFLFIGISISSFSQFKVYTLDLASNDIVYDKNTNKLYTSLSSANGSNGNSIGIINLETYKLEKTVFIGSEPTVLAISDNGQYMYTGFDGASIVRRFDVATQTAGLQFSLGADSFLGAYYVEDIEVMPGKPNTIAISRRYKSVTPRHGGVAIYDDNIIRSTTTPGHSGSNIIEFTSANSLIGYNNESTEYGIRRLSVNNAGVTNVSETGNVLSGFGLNFSYFNNRMYSYNGKVIDITYEPYVLGEFSNANGPVVYDQSNDKACFASYDGGGNITFKRYNAETFLLSDSFPISQAFGYAGSIVTCGEGCYAFNTSDSKVIIIKDTSLGLSTVTSKVNIEVYPNPTADYINIKSTTKTKRIELLDVNGRLIRNFETNTEKIDLTNFEKGIYFIKIIDLNDNITTKKIIKK